MMADERNREDARIAANKKGKNEGRNANLRKFPLIKNNIKILLDMIFDNCIICISTVNEVVMEFHIDPSSRLALYQQIAGQLRESIARGGVLPDERLPSVRDLSRTLVVNPNTVARVYTELEREGLLYTQAGRGVFVARPKAELTPQARRLRFDELLDHFLTAAVHLGYSADEVLSLVADRVKQFQWQAKGAMDTS
jgi:GntR family transcriptional regulator